MEIMISRIYSKSRTNPTRILFGSNSAFISEFAKQIAVCEKIYKKEQLRSARSPVCVIPSEGNEIF